MSTHVKLADGVKDREAVFRLRHCVYVDEEQHMSPTPDGLISDPWDARASTVHVMATKDAQIVGAARFVPSSDDGLPTDDWWHFATHAPSDAVIWAGGMLCLSRSERRSPRLLSRLLSFGFSRCEALGATHIVGLCNAAHEGLFRHLGYLAVGAPVRIASISLPAIPMLLDLRDIHPTLRAVMSQLSQLEGEPTGIIISRPGEVVAAPDGDEIVPTRGQFRRLTRADACAQQRPWPRRHVKVLLSETDGELISYRQRIDADRLSAVG